MKNNLKTIHKIDIWSFSKLYGLFGLLMGIITGILNVAGYTILLFLGALIFSIFYNAYAKNGRGIKVELE